MAFVCLYAIKNLLTHFCPKIVHFQQYIEPNVWHSTLSFLIIVVYWLQETCSWFQLILRHRCVYRNLSTVAIKCNCPMWCYCSCGMRRVNWREHWLVSRSIRCRSWWSTSRGYRMKSPVNRKRWIRYQQLVFILR